TGFIFIICFQMAFAETAINVNASRTPAELHELSLVQIRKRIEDFKVMIKGKEDTSHCEDKEELFFDADRPFSTPVRADGLPDFDQLLADMKVNSCGEYARQWDSLPEDKPANEDECLPVKTQGLIEKLAE